MAVRRIAVLAVAAGLAFAGVARADDEHHPGSSAPPQSTQAPAQPPATAQTPQGSMMGHGGMMGQGGPSGMMGPGGGQGMMGAMGPDNMVRMMDMMRMMGMMGQSGPGAMSGGRGMGEMRMQAMAEHVEGRIAFLKTELKIGQAQTREWNQFADALRNNAQKLAAARPSAPQSGTPPTLVDHMAQQERWLAARYEGVRAIKMALEHLYGTFSNEQKQIAERIVPPHLGLMPMRAM